MLAIMKTSAFRRMTGSRALGALLLLLSAPACDGEVVVPPRPVHRGIVSVLQNPGSSPWVGTYVQFIEQIDDPCTTLDTEGSCRLVGCKSGWGLPGTFAYVDAGTITITGSLGEAVVPFGEHTYGPGHHDGLVFATGDLLRLDVAGSDTIAPIAVTLPIPPPPVVTSVPDGSVIDRSLPFAIAWDSDAPAGQVRAWIDMHPAVDVGDLYIMLQCSADLSAGRLEMSPALLSALSPGPHDQPTLSVRYGAYEEVSDEGWQLQISAEALAPKADGTFVSRDVTFK